ncbi:hypothetical protein EJ03DRAFT_41631 [Teratosphaeria nubilosa]|uniref:Uncharacterized protein n=1 Tax=Teratosphaeria nubilosa TaxID=161662 RepID=A0A6G1KUJ9_9PEZI|nr:hypothetical protein EJ03DRAFT_41631 [Teratosphaeria nubilosa]
MTLSAIIHALNQYADLPAAEIAAKLDELGEECDNNRRRKVGDSSERSVTSQFQNILPPARPVLNPLLRLPLMTTYRRNRNNIPRLKAILSKEANWLRPHQFIAYFGSDPATNPEFLVALEDLTGAGAFVDVYEALLRARDARWGKLARQSSTEVERRRPQGGSHGARYREPAAEKRQAPSRRSQGESQC